MAQRNRRNYTGEEKVAILKRHLVGDETVSDICDELGLNPNLFYRWQKELFANGAAAFEKTGRREKRRKDKLEQKVERLEAKLSHKDEVIAEIMEEHVALKKELGEA